VKENDTKVVAFNDKVTELCLRLKTPKAMKIKAFLHNKFL
jgi:hypothetical protein